MCGHDYYYASPPASSTTNDRLTEIWNDRETVVVQVRNPLDALNRVQYPFDDARKVLVEPTARKAYSSGWINLQWRRAYDMIRCAHEIVIIGYSLTGTHSQ